MPKFIHFHTTGRPDKIHSLIEGDGEEEQAEVLCSGADKAVDDAVALLDIAVVQAKWPTCSACLGSEWAETPGAEEAWLEAHGHDKKLAWREDSPAPQISRRETY
jgi:hypothetical protein